VIVNNCSCAIICFCVCCQAGQTPLSIAQRLGFLSAVELLEPVTSRKAVLTRQPVVEQDASLLMVEPETMLDPVSVESDDETGQPAVI